ncbi:ubiquinol oxidase subunit II [Stappia sp. BW2]|uniref:ubiquinol oxidase subunit II n=1 Tax=Stappia sp. BW2 TaxID=2592622 RepID=UPI0011DEE34A|nr:ubiquinol oxidase subunit II [Stappia sp. BW2]TYC64116.1 ubiquinol oxidase subunit II [Stappia sp. BW2]
MRLSKLAPLLAAAPFLSGCNMVVMNPAGDIASQQAELIIYSTILMLIVVLPVMALTVIFAIKYRSSNKDAEYQPDWHHSTSLEIVIWTVPMAIIMCLAGLTWVATHRLDPYSPLERISAEKEIPAGEEPLVIQVVAMDWKWLFIYPEQGVAAVNELAAPVDRPVKFEITSSTVMNSFFVPALAGQIYAMAGMQTELNAVMNEEGVYDGFSSNYSGAGFSHMRFKFHSVDEKGFEDWVAKAQDSEQPLDRTAFLKLDEPSIANPVSYYGSVDPELWNAVINLCVDSNDLCQNDMMMVDALGGGGLEGLQLRDVFAGICSSSNPTGMLTRIRGKREVKKAEGQLEPLSLAAINVSGVLKDLAGSPKAGPESGTQPETDR